MVAVLRDSREGGAHPIINTIIPENCKNTLHFEVRSVACSLKTCSSGGQQ